MSTVAVRTAQTRSTKPKAATQPETIGACVIYLGGLNYFFSVEQRCPIVSRIGTVIGQLRVTIEPFIAPPWANGTRDTNVFEAYSPPHIDSPEEQVCDYMDRTIEYRVTLHEITELHVRKHTHVQLRYAFYRDTNQQSDPIAVTGPDITLSNCSSRHIIDVSDALIKYLNGNTFMIEAFGVT